MVRPKKQDTICLACQGNLRRLYHREQERMPPIEGRRFGHIQEKWTPVGWRCDDCHVLTWDNNEYQSSLYVRHYVKRKSKWQRVDKRTRRNMNDQVYERQKTQLWREIGFEFLKDPETTTEKLEKHGMEHLKFLEMTPEERLKHLMKEIENTYKE